MKKHPIVFSYCISRYWEAGYTATKSEVGIQAIEGALEVVTI